MAIRLKIKLENGVHIDTIITTEKAKKIDKLKSYKEIVNENNRRFKAYQYQGKKWQKLPTLNLDKRIIQLTRYVNDLIALEA